MDGDSRTLSFVLKIRPLPLFDFSTMRAFESLLRCLVCIRKCVFFVLSTVAAREFPPPSQREAGGLSFRHRRQEEGAPVCAVSDDVT